MTVALDALYASDGVAPAVRATVSSTRLPGDMDIITDTVANWPHKGIATSGTPDDAGIIIPDTECVFEYVLSGTIIHITGFAPGYSDIGHEENQIVILKPTTYHTDSLVKKVEDIASQPNLPAGGTTGQILTKVSNTDGDADWETPPEPEVGNSIVTKEVPTGLINGSNTTFFTSQPYTAATLQGYINGLAQSFELNETSPTTGEFTITPAPLTGDDLVVSYMFGTVGTMAADTLDGYHAAGTPTANNIPVLDGNAQLPAEIINNPYSFSARASGSQNSGNAAFAKVSFATEVWDTNEDYDTSTSTYTAPVDGIYIFNSTVSTAVAGRFIVSLFKNGSEYKRGTDVTVSSGRIGAHVSARAMLSAGDTVEVRSWGSSSLTLASAGAEVWFDGGLERIT